MEEAISSKKVGYFLERTTRIVKLAFTQAFSKLNVDLTPEQWVILDSLYHKNGQSQVELASSSYKNAPTISRIIDLLEKKGWVERRRFDDDKRRYSVYLTPSGNALAEKIQPTADELRKQSWANLTDKDYEEFLRIINQVFRNFEAKDK